ncbi:hypothetical protein C0993_003037 [Termitomyces sp. T159_Od127]|nr:hypothetical protein C0993_003037 [Termitomyces sp. T159_Od127]
MTEAKSPDADSPEPPSSTQHVPPAESTKSETGGSEISTTLVTDRSELLSRARGFLQSPQIMHQDAAAKRRFLLEKGLNENEIDGLLSEIRFFLPRIIKTALARQSLQKHHLSLLQRLSESLASLKESQTEVNTVLPTPDPSQEAPTFQLCRTIADILKLLDDKNPDMHSIPPITLLRCSLQGLGKGKEGEVSQPTTEELFRYMEGQVPWLVSEEGQKYEELLWKTLSTSSLFTGTTPEGESGEDQTPTRWSYNNPAPVEPSPVVKSIKKLTISLPKNSEPRHKSREHTLQALSEFTGYISTQMYMPYQAPSSAAGFLSGHSSSIGPAEEEFRREIRALKGLVLNRRSFMPTIPRPPMSTP